MNLHTTVECTNAPLEPSAIDKLYSRINAVSNKVSNITPYEASKTAYIGDTVVSFDKAKEGMINAKCITESGLEIPTTLEITDKINVLFEALEEVAEVKIIIQ